MWRNRISCKWIRSHHQQLTAQAPNTDQGSQFTSLAFTDGLKDARIQISMDGKGRWMDNVFIERLWRSLKYEQVYLAEYATGSDARAGIGWWIEFYNTRRPALVARGPNARRSVPMWGLFRDRGSAPPHHSPRRPDL